MEEMEGTSILEERSTAEEKARVPTDEWTAASLAHASALLTLILGAPGGLGVPIGLAVPLVMYFGYRQRSRFVAFHALQSFVFQLLGTLAVGAFAAWVAISWSVSSALTTVLVGFLFMPFALLLTLFLICLPFALVGYGLYAAYQVYQGNNFYYALIGERLEREVRA